jgi:glycerate-2-kinase
MTMKIQNFDQLATTPARRALLEIAEAGLVAIDTGVVIRAMVRRDGDVLTIGGEEIDLKQVERLVFVAVGKCAADAAVAAEDILGARITRGVVLDIKKCPETKYVRTFCGTHPLPSSENLAATEEIVASLKDLTEHDLVIFVISGGGSTLLFLPQNRDDREEVAIFNALTNAGATIEELNTVRKHLSLARGGWLAEYAYPARVMSLIFSDVPGDDISFISSGPTVKDGTTMQDAEAVLTKFDVLHTCGIEKCDLIETPKDDKYFARVKNILAVSNRRALEAMQSEAQKLGFAADIRDTKLAGEVTGVAEMVVNAVRGAPPKSVILWGGETTVEIKGKGEGGRNLQLAATALDRVADGEEILSFGSDGHDHGPYAGAICDAVTRQAILNAGLDYKQFRANNDTQELFSKAGNYLLTGDTGSNVSDLIIALKTTP